MQIHLIALLVCLPSFYSCQQDPLSVQSLTANLGPSAEKNLEDDDEPDPAATLNVIFKSADIGETWQDISAGMPNGMFIEGLTFQNNTIFYGNESWCVLTCQIFHSYQVWHTRHNY
jgi:hypothetical protein